MWEHEVFHLSLFVSVCKCINKYEYYELSQADWDVRDVYWESWLADRDVYRELWLADRDVYWESWLANQDT